MKNLFITILIIGLLISEKISSQQNFDCGTLPDENVNNFSVPTEGYYKPNRTDTLNGIALPEDAVLPVLVVFVQFKNEASDPRHTWDTNSAPIYLDSLISRTKKTSGNWWNFYNPETEIISSHWMEISRGKLHVISPQGAFSVVLSQEASYYAQFGADADTVINEEIWKSLHSQGLTDWRSYDRWRQDYNGHFYFEPAGQADSVVDMIYKVHKSRNTGGLADFAGYATLSYQNNQIRYLADTSNQIRINYSGGVAGSGITVSFRGQLAQYLGTIGHEHGHYVFSAGGHSTYSRVSYGFGFDNFSPSDMILNGYMTPTNANINSVNYLGDYSSRNSGNGNLLKVPIQGNEYFLLASRNKYSKWDRVMTGDVAQIDAHEDNSDYGKGLYIYHVPNDIQLPVGDTSLQDMECADGVFEWEYAGQSAQQVVHDCFISGATDWYYYKKKKVIYENDSSNLYKQAPPLGYTRPVGDGISLRHYVGIVNNEYTYNYKWWGVGDQPTNSCNIGTDRLFTNDEEIYTRFDIGGDREDAWKPGYNEVFSPYSSPNTNTWTTNPSNQNSGIFIWYYFHSGSGPTDAAYIKIYKTGSLSLDSILHLTPPSRPMGLRVLPCDSLPVSGGYKRIKIGWNHNQEPDMRQVVEGDTIKRYKIYRSVSEILSVAPPDALAYSENYYVYIATQDVSTDDLPEFTDTLKSICTLPPPGGVYHPYPVRYRVRAVDKYTDVSVLSDFANTQAWTTTHPGGGEEENRIPLSEDNNIPDNFDLKQNFPNPFNPNTNIRYDLPFHNFVSIKIFDVLGKEVVTLVNELKNAGRYIISFNGSNLSSGIYYYKIKAG